MKFTIIYIWDDDRQVSVSHCKASSLEKALELFTLGWNKDRYTKEYPPVQVVSVFKGHHYDLLVNYAGAHKNFILGKGKEL